MPGSSLASAWQAFISGSDAELAGVGAGGEAPQAPPGLDAAVKELCGAGQGELVASLYLDKVEGRLRHTNLPSMWSALRVAAGGEGAEGGALSAEEEGALGGSLRDLRALVEAYEACVGRLSRAMVASGCAVGTGLPERFWSGACALLLQSAPPALPALLTRFFVGKVAQFSRRAERHLKGRPPLAPGEESEEEDEEEEEESSEDEEEGEGGGGVGKMAGLTVPAATPEELLGARWAGEAAGVAAGMRVLRLGALGEQAYSAAVCRHLVSYVQEKTGGDFDKAVLPRMRAWIGSVPLKFLALLVGEGEGGADEDETLQQWRARLEFIGYETVGAQLTAGLFDVIIEFPDSLPAVVDLRECITHTNQSAELISSFRAVVRQRLLHPGAATTDILHQYVSAIKTLRVLDSTGVVLEAVGEPIREYLRQRKDTIRCIVTMLTDDTGGGGGETLFEELGRSSGDPAEIEGEDAGGEMEGDEAALAAEKTGGGWDPDPVEANPYRSTSSRKMSDIIGMLVGIYGSKELFINEYRAMLADKLLAKDDYDTDREIRTLELLKLRFGESNLHSCEVMVKDLADSRRINNNVKNAPLPSPGGTAAVVSLKAWDVDIATLNSTVVSALFWPPFQAGEGDFKLPGRVQERLDAYADRFHNLKSPRKLVWKPHLGTVRLELEFSDRTQEYSVSPVHAAMIMHFEEQSEWRGPDLAAAMGFSTSALRRRAVYWVNQGVLVESRDAAGELAYSLVSSLEEAASAAGAGGGGDEEADSAVASSEQQLAQEMAVYESYVIGMLTNFDALPLDRIHNMLKMFVAEPPYEKSAQQLAAFLSKLVAEEKLVCEGALYRRRT